ncbi:MAG: transglycosylase SLT domain-containing protein [Chloroflexota bacterium]|nr:transglycosylase SLT domain-containing protein [Chloroflexota bacterium]
MEFKAINSTDRGFGLRRLALVAGLLGLLIGAILLWGYRDYLRSPQELYGEARSASPERAAVLYDRLAEKLPQIEEYTQLWAAEAAMPDLAAIRTLQAVIDFRPESPVAYSAHIAIARYYASMEARRAEDEYRAALALHETIALRLELARYLEQQGDNKGAYAEYQRILPKQADAFAGMRRTGQDPLAIARDLNSAEYYTDALETLRGSDNPKALPLRAQALTGLGRHEEARVAYEAWLKENPDDVNAQMELARTLSRLDLTDQALSLFQKVKTPDSRLAQADLLEEKDPNQALALYLESPYPVAWWSATRILEAQGRLTETLPIYARVGKTDTAFADDAAYRLYVLAQRLGDKEAQAKGKAQLDELGLNWLALRAGKGEPLLATAPPLATAGIDILEKAQVLESLGREDLAHLELLLAARSRRAPEVSQAMAEALASRGYVVEAQAIAEEYIQAHPRAPLAFWQLSYPRPYSDTVNAAAAEFKIDPLLIWAVMRQESRYDPEALSYAGARGLMQIVPSTQTWIAEQLKEDILPGAAYIPKANIRMGTWFLHFLTDYFEGDLDLVIAAYNGGAASVDQWQADPRVSNRDDLLRWIGFGETREYLERVSLGYRVYQELYAGRSNVK